jgi:hypothetical protein
MASPDAIWDMTLTQGADGIWRKYLTRQPLAGRPMKLVGKDNLKLGDVFEHKHLFPEAPWLPETKRRSREHPDIGGGFLPADPARSRVEIG